MRRFDDDQLYPHHEAQQIEEDLRKSRMDERQIAIVLKKDRGLDPSRPTYPRMFRRHLSVETLHRCRIYYEFDQVRQFEVASVFKLILIHRMLTMFLFRDGFLRMPH
jgi:hypothetical protein